MLIFWLHLWKNVVGRILGGCTWYYKNEYFSALENLPTERQFSVMEFAGFRNYQCHGSWIEESGYKLAATVFVAASLLLHTADGGLSRDTSLQIV